jgi:hypothetical protein
MKSPSPRKASFAALSLCLALAATLGAGTLAIAAGPLSTEANADATITFRKIFKTSYPEFVEIRLEHSGAGTYDIRDLDEEASPQPLELGPALVQRVFALAAKLHNFQGVDLDVHRRIANLGEKTFRYEKPGELHQVTFNYTIDDSATQLLNIFEGITRQQLDLSNLQRVMRYDRLGVNDSLAQLETDYNNKLLVEPERLLPTLDQLAGDDKFLDIARNRARVLAGKIRASH